MKKYILTESQIRNLVNNVVDESKKGETKYPPEYLEKIKEKYKGKLLYSFIHGEDSNAYSAVKKLGTDFYNDFTKDMIRIGNKKCPDYTKSELRNIAKKCETRTEFIQKHSCAYKAARNLGPFITNPNGEVLNTYDFYESIIPHMGAPNNLSKRLVYVFEFYDENKIPAGVYVGLTYNSEIRKGQHEMGINYIGKESLTAVSKFIKENPTLTYVYDEKTDYINTNEAVKLEKYWEKEYFLKNWNILNVAKTGGLGKMGKSLNQIKKELDYVYNVVGIKTLKDLQNSKEYIKLYAWAQRWGLNDPKNEGYLLGKFERDVVYKKTNDEVMDDVKKHKSYDDFYNDKKLYNIVSKRKTSDGKKLIQKVKDYFGELYTDEHFINMVLKFNNYNDFYNSKYYNLCRKRKLLPKIKELFVQKEQEQQNEPVE